MSGKAASGIGELFMLGFRGPEIPGWLREFARRFGLGGVLLFDYDVQRKAYENNVHSPEQVRELCAALHELPSGPLLFVDQEGGKVRRLKEKLGFAPLPSALAFARLAPAERREVAERSFRELRSLGFHYDLAPVVDVNYNPANPDIGAHERSFSGDAAEVRACALAQAEAARAAGLGLCLKHYPGLGAARVNSHEELTDISGTVTDEQLALFHEVGAAIPGRAVLVSHGIVREWDEANPVSTSPAALARLRKALPDAWIVSDDLQMQGLQRRCSTEEACERAVAAGVDLLIIGNNMIHEDERVLGYAEALARRAEREPALAARVREATERARARKAEAVRAFPRT